MNEIKNALFLIFKGIELLQKKYPNRKFTIDGRLVGDIGEILAAENYDIELDLKSQPKHDGTLYDGKRVQIKATFKNTLTIKEIPEYYLGLKINKDGTFEEIYNGPGKMIEEKFSNRSALGKKLINLPNSVLMKLSAEIEEKDRIKKRVNPMNEHKIINDKTISDEDNDIIIEPINKNKNVSSAKLDQTIDKLYNSLNLPHDMEKFLEEK